MSLSRSLTTILFIKFTNVSILHKFIVLFSPFGTKINGKILGPINAPIYRVRKNFRNRILIRSKKSYKIQNSLTKILKNYKLASGIKLTVDVDPITFN